MKTNIDRQLRYLKLSPDLSSVKIKFQELVAIPAAEGEDESTVRRVPYTVDGPVRPHKDLVNCMRKLRKHGLAIQNIKLEDESKAIQEWSVVEIKIDGDTLTQQSRVQMKLGKLVPLTGKVSKMPVAQVSMYPTTDEKVKYHAAAEMTAIIEDLIEECWSYLNGKYDEALDKTQQIPLFPTEKPVLRKAS